MPPKRKAAAKKSSAGGKKAKKTEPEEPAPSTVKDVITKLKTQTDKKTVHKKDPLCNLAGAQVLDDYDCMLNQTNIGHNNNKFYVIQVLKDSSGQFYTWNRWGRVGESGANSLKGPLRDCAAAIKDFEKKFKDKTSNSWSERNNFHPVQKKYTLLEMADDDDDDDEVDAPELDKPKKKGDEKSKNVTPSKLDKNTQDLLNLILNHDMFRDTMANFNIDVKKMPLGKLSKSQIAKGFEVLEELEEVLKKKKKSGNIKEIENLSSKFYTFIPHNFGRQVPKPITTLEALQKKMDMLAVLGDIEIATSLEKEKDKAMAAGTKDNVTPNPLDINYNLLNCDLEPVDSKTKEFKVISKYTTQTQGSCKTSIQNVWKVNRHGEVTLTSIIQIISRDKDKRFKAYDKIPERKLLWHGTSVAVVVAILKSGLRIMPHSGGRVGRGIYFASEHQKSASYVGRINKIGIMFLCEVVLGKQKEITVDSPSLKEAPPGFSSVVARGRTEPDSKEDTVLEMDGKKVTVPQGKPVNQPEFSKSHFSQSEYLVYNEDQVRIRYLLQLKFPY